PDVVAPQATVPRFDSRTRLLLEGPIVGTLLRLATPNVLVMFVQAAVGLIETYFVAKLGTDALAGVALVFPVLMLMQMMSAGAVGGGIMSAIARALGAGRRADADALVLHALAIAVSFGLVFMLAVLGGGRWLYGALGGRGASLAAALTYSNVVFSGAIVIWIFISLANVIRRPDHRPDQSHHRDRDGIRRPVRARGDRRLRHGLAPRVPPGPPRLRVGWPARRHGGNQHRRRPAWPRVARGLDRRRYRRGSHG